MKSLTRSKSTVPDPHGEFLDDEGVAKLLKVAPKTVREWRRYKGLPFIRLSTRAVRIGRGDLDTWLSDMRERLVNLDA